MKISFILLFVSLVGFAFSAEPSAYKLESSSSSEIFSTKILKIYQVEMDASSYVAYVVDWRGQEIVVTPSIYSLPQASLKVGDSVRCSMRTSLVVPGSNKKAYLSFDIVPVADREHLEAVANEVRDRRERREASIKGISSNNDAAEPKK
jgi:hypothetical protein